MNRTVICFWKASSRRMKSRNGGSSREGCKSCIGRTTLNTSSMSLAAWEVRSVFAIHDNNKPFMQLAAHPRLTAITNYLIGTETYIHQSRISFKPGFTGKEFYWHSDFETWHVEDGMPRMRALSCSIALEDNFHFNGPLMVVPDPIRSLYPALARRRKTTSSNRFAGRNTGFRTRKVLRNWSRRVVLIPL